jgi:uncharacterized protein (DUF169 family)
MSEIVGKLNEALEKHLRPATFPVGVKLAGEGEEIGQRHKRPSADFHNPIAACQGLNIARTIGWTMVFGKDDHACPLGSIAAGHMNPDPFLEGTVAGLYQDDPEVSRRMEATYPRNPVGEVGEIWLSPLSRCEFDPDLAIVYGNPAQVLILIHAANYGYGVGIQSHSTGRFGCSAWIAGALQSDEYAYVVPGSGERIFAGTQDHEMSFIIPQSKFESLIEGLRVMWKKGSYRYPVPSMNLLNQPAMPREYDLLKQG